MKNAALKDGTAGINSVGEGANAPGYAPLTAQSIGKSVRGALKNLSGAFLQLEQRIVGDNGKRYPLDATLPDGVQDSGNIEIVNRFAFIERSLVSCVVWKLESMVDDSARRINEQRDKIRNAVRQLSSGRSDERMIDRMADFLETLTEQHAMLLVAFESAKDAHAGILGEDFETKAVKAERSRQTLNDTTPMSERLKRLGIS